MESMSQRQHGVHGVHDDAWYAYCKDSMVAHGMHGSMAARTRVLQHTLLLMPLPL